MNAFRTLSNRVSCRVCRQEGSKTLAEYLNGADKILIAGHNNPDGDCVGSAFAFHNYLKNLGKNARVIFPNNCAKNLLWMDTDRISFNFMHHTDTVKRLIDECDLLMIMDFNRLSRTEGMAPLLEACKAPRIMIDHHLDPDWDFVNLGFSDTTVSSTCELLYHIFYAELKPELVDAAVSDCLYAGISTDTGSFSYSCGHKEVFSAISDLIARGMNPIKVHQNIFDNFSESRMRLLGCCLGERLIVKREYHTAYMYLKEADMNKYNYQSGDTEGIVNYGLSIAGVKFAVFFTQREGRIRMSFRSQGNIDVNLFAKRYFNGGGHKNAAGGTSTESMEAVLEKFESVLPEYYEEVIKPNLEPQDFEKL